MKYLRHFPKKEEEEEEELCRSSNVKQNFIYRLGVISCFLTAQQ